MKSEKEQELISLAEQYFQNKKYHLSEALLKKLILLTGSHRAKAYELLAYIYGNQGDKSLSYQHLQQACKQENASAEAHYYLGASFLKIKKFEAAQQELEKSINKAGDFFEALHDLGTAYANMGMNEKALHCYYKALALRPNSFELFFNIARTFDGLKRYQKALTYYDRAISLNPKFHLAWSNKGTILDALERYDEALSCHNKAIELDSSSADSWTIKGCTLMNLKMSDEALSCHNKAIELDPDCFQAFWNKSLLKLSLGDYEEGWELYKYRWKKNNAEEFRYAQINLLDTLNDLCCKKVLVWHEQGFGDTLQFSRYVDQLIKKKAIVTFQVQKELHPFLVNQFDCEIVTDPGILTNYDFQIPLLDLPRLFHTSIYSKQLNLKASEEKLNLWRKKLQLTTSKFNIGLAVSGRSTHINDNKRSTNLEAVHEILGLGSYFLLQKDINSSDAQYLIKHPEINSLGNEIKDYADTAAIIEMMDIIISVDTSLIHLAGTLGKRSYLMLPYSSEWRWLQERQDSPWYPSIKIFRQESPGDWKSVLLKLRNQILEDYNHLLINY